MNNTCLIIGYGRAGKRHAKYAAARGYRVVAVDPYLSSGSCDDMLVYNSIDHALGNELVNMAVIATPPELHIEQARRLIGQRIPTLVEKPICGLGQFAEAIELERLAHCYDVPLGATYNYRFHPAVIAARDYNAKTVSHYACQYRELPYWGLLLDHVSHSIDIVDQVCRIVSIDSAVYTPKDYRNNESWYITGTTSNNGSFNLVEEIAVDSPRSVHTTVDGKRFDIDASTEMFNSMWDNWLAYVEKRSADKGIAFDIRPQSFIGIIYRMASK